MTPAEAGLPSHNLTTRITIRPFASRSVRRTDRRKRFGSKPCLTRRVCRRIFKSPGLRKHPGVGLQRMVQGGLDDSLLSCAWSAWALGTFVPQAPPFREGSLTRGLSASAQMHALLRIDCCRAVESVSSSSIASISRRPVVLSCKRQSWDSNSVRADAATSGGKRNWWNINPSSDATPLPINVLALMKLGLPLVSRACS